MGVVVASHQGCRVDQHAVEAGGITVTGNASTGAIASDSDSDSLVLFRDGFDRATAAPMRAAQGLAAAAAGAWDGAGSACR